MSPSVSLCLLQTQSDARLLELARTGHERAFEALVQRYRKPLLSYCRRLLIAEARAEDALQQGLLQAWLALQGGGEVRDAKAWLYRIAHNAAISAKRRSGYDYVELNESLHGERAPESDIDRRIAVREALAGLAALPEQQREALLLTAVQGHSHEQVAAALGVSDGAVRGLIYRARATLRSAVTAVTPPQIALWAARTAGRGSPHVGLAEIAGGGGSAGALGALMKGGAVVVSAGVLATGATIAQHGVHTTSSAQAAAGTPLGNHRTLTSAADPGHSTARFAVGSYRPAGLVIAAGHRRRGDRRRHHGHRYEPSRLGDRPEPSESADGEDGMGSSGVDTHDKGSGGKPTPSATDETDGSGDDHRSVGGGDGGAGGGPGGLGGKGPGEGRGSAESGSGGSGPGPKSAQGPSSAGPDDGGRSGGQSSGGGPGDPAESVNAPSHTESAPSEDGSGKEQGSNGSGPDRPNESQGGPGSDGSGKSER